MYLFPHTQSLPVPIANTIIIIIIFAPANTSIYQCTINDSVNSAIQVPYVSGIKQYLFVPNVYWNAFYG